MRKRSPCRSQILRILRCTLDCIYGSCLTARPLKAKKGLLLAIPLILVLIAGAAFVLNRTHSEGTAVDASSDYVVVYADNSYTLIPLNNKYEKVPLGTIVCGDPSDDYVPEVQFSPDGKYVFSTRPIQTVKTFSFAARNAAS